MWKREHRTLDRWNRLYGEGCSTAGLSLVVVQMARIARKHLKNGDFAAAYPAQLDKESAQKTLLRGYADGLYTTEGHKVRASKSLSF